MRSGRVYICIKAALNGNLTLNQMPHTVKTDWCMSLEIVNGALDYSKSSALFTISSDMHQSVFTVHGWGLEPPKLPCLSVIRKVMQTEVWFHVPTQVKFHMHSYTMHVVRPITIIRVYMLADTCTNRYKPPLCSHLTKNRN